MAGTEQEPAYRTFSYPVKDAMSGKHLVRLANAVNTTWNYVNEVSEKSARRGPKWATKKQLRDLTKGASQDIGLPSQVIHEVIYEFIGKRKQAGRPKLRWRVRHARCRGGSALCATGGERKPVQTLAPTGIPSHMKR